MAIGRNNFNLVTAYSELDVKDFMLDFTGANMPANLQPGDADVLRDGELLSLAGGTAALTYRMRRAASVATECGGAANPAGDTAAVNVPAWFLYAERGRTDIQAFADPKVPVIWRGSFEADTQLYDVTNLAAMVPGVRLVCVRADAEAAGYANFSVLRTMVRNDTPATPADATGGMTFGFVTRASAFNGTRGVRFFGQAGGFGFNV